MGMAYRAGVFSAEVVQARRVPALGLCIASEPVSILRNGQRIMVVEPSRQWYGSISERLTELCALERGWDGYNAEPVAFDTANFALRMLEAICGSDAPPPSIVPGPNGDLQVEWHTDDTDIELHVRGPNDVHAWRSSPAAAMGDEEFRLTNDFTLVADWIRGLVESSGAAEAAAA